MADAAIPPAAGPDRETATGDRGQWPDWPVSRATAGLLARYVSPTHAARWVPAGLQRPPHGPQRGRRTDRVERVERLYAALAAYRVRYAGAPWHPATHDPAGRAVYQRIRTAAETIQGPATSLDLVLTFAAMAIAADLRPVLAIRFTPTPHAVIVLDLASEMPESTDFAASPVLPGFNARRDESGIWDQHTDRALAGLARTAGWLPLDVAGATRDYQVTFAEASGTAMTEVADPAGASWVLVDVRRVQARLSAAGISAYQPPAGYVTRSADGRADVNRRPADSLDSRADVTRVPGDSRRGPAEGRQPGQRPRYLSASYPGSIQPGRRFSLEVAVTLSHGAGRAEQRMSPFHVGPQGKALRLTVFAPQLTVHGEHELLLVVPPDRDSRPVRFDLESSSSGVRRIRLRAWDGGTCVGELWAEVMVSDRGASGQGRVTTGQLEAAPVPGEVTLEVSRERSGGGDGYTFRLQDPVTAPAPVYLPLRDDPAKDVERLIDVLDMLAENTDGYIPPRVYRALRQEGIQLWERLVPDAVRQQFWACQHRIGQFTILADNDAVPWELLYPRDGSNDSGFLSAQHFPVTRRIHGRERPRWLTRRPARFVLPPNAPLRAVDEVASLRQLLDASEQPVSNLMDVQDLIDDGAFGVLHFACHGSYSRAAGEPRISLDRPFLPRELFAAGANWRSPLVFLNACRSAGPRYHCAGTDSFAELFLRANAGAFIGSLWEVRDDAAGEFAWELYSRLRGGQELGEAVTGLRKIAARDGDPTWLAYAVYGHPQARMD